MTHRGPAAAQIILSADERPELKRRANGTDQRAAQRAQIVLACAEDRSNPQVTQTAGVSLRTAGRRRAQFAGQRLPDVEVVGPTGRPKTTLVLSTEERVQLQRWAQRAKTAQYLALRAKIVLRGADDGTDKQIAAGLPVDASTVQRWRARFIGAAWTGCRTSHVPAPRSRQVEDVIIAALESTPGHASRWRHALVTGVDGRAQRAVRVDHRSDLEELRSQAPPAGQLYTLHRSVVRRQG